MNEMKVVSIEEARKRRRKHYHKFSQTPIFSAEPPKKVAYEGNSILLYVLLPER